MIEFEQLDMDYQRRQMLPLVPISDELIQMAYYDKYMREFGQDDQLLSGVYSNLYE